MMEKVPTDEELNQLMGEDIFEISRMDYSEYIINLYDNTHQYHDGKWLYIDIINGTVIEDIKRLLLIKKKTNRKRV